MQRLLVLLALAGGMSIAGTGLNDKMELIRKEAAALRVALYQEASPSQALGINRRLIAQVRSVRGGLQKKSSQARELDHLVRTLSTVARSLEQGNLALARRQVEAHRLLRNQK